MKKFFFTLSGLFLLGFSLNAQPILTNSIVRNQKLSGSEVLDLPDFMPLTSYQKPTGHGTPQAKTTGATIYSQSFSSLPSGWVVSSNVGSIEGWRWANAAPSGPSNKFPVLALINSSTKSNGWLLYNADSVINNSGSIKPFGGAITSSSISIGSSHANVMLSFQQYFRLSQGDSCFVDVSNDGLNWTAFPINPNSSLTQYAYLYHNPTLTTLNISSVAGGKAAIYVRFRFNSTAPQYGFNWLIDDLLIYDADAKDLGLANSGIVSASATGSGFTSSYGFSTIPLSLVDTVYPITYYSNYGLSAVTNAVLTARYFLNGVLVNTQTNTLNTAPMEARDSVFIFDKGFKPTAIGDYVVALNINQTGDSNPQNDGDTIRFSVTDTSYATHGTEFMDRTTYLSRLSTGTYQYWGSRFTISNGKNDTITSVSAAFRPVTTVGTRIQAQLYQAFNNGTSYDWSQLAFSTTRTLTAADISTSSNMVLTSFPFRVLNKNFGPLILGNGDYAVVLTTVNATGDAAVYSMAPPLPTAPSFIGYQGQSDNSTNDGTNTFAVAGGIATGIVQVPFVHPNFGNTKMLLAVKKMEHILVGVASPNPSISNINIPYSLQESGNVTLTLSNPIGQVLSCQNLGYKNAGSVQNAQLLTTHLPDGLYFFTIQSNGNKAMGRFEVKH